MNFRNIEFNRNELAGAFGDIGTDFPLLTAMILAAGLYTPGVLIVFGVMQIFTGLIYKMPMPVQPLKAMATLVIAQKIAGNVLFGAGLAIGLTMLILTLTGAIEKLAKIVPKTIIRGLQLGLGISLCSLAFKQYIPEGNLNGYILAGISFCLTIFLIDNKKFPASILVISTGVIYSLLFNSNFSSIDIFPKIYLPILHVPNIDDLTTGFLLLAIPQIPLSLGNSILATKQVAHDLFPKTQLSTKKIGFTYALMNLVTPFLSGIPVCHGAGGMVGHYTFGGRTGGSVIIYGFFYLILGFFFGSNIHSLINIFPLPVLGVILLFEGLAMMFLIKDLFTEKRNLLISLLTGIIAFGLPYGFLIAMIIGMAIYYSPFQLKTLISIGDNKNT